MNFRLLGVIVLLSGLAATTASAQTKTYADGYNDGYRDACLANGGCGHGGTGGGSNFRIGQSITFYNWPGSGTVGGDSNMQRPDYFILPFQNLTDGQAGVLSGGAIPLYGTPDLKNKDVWNSIASQAIAKSGLPGDNLSVYAVPVGPLLKNSDSVPVLKSDGGANSAPPLSADLGTSSAILQKFGRLPSI